MGLFPTRSEILRHKKSINKYKEIEILPYILLAHKGIKLEINKKLQRNSNNMETKQYTAE
jgi:hypothetical protein